MATAESRGKVRAIIEEEGKFLVSFTGHDGYFNTPDLRLRQLLAEAHEEEKEISFTYDRNLTILEIT